MASVNKVILLGRVGNPPELKQTQNGGMLTTLSLATNSVWMDKQGQKQEDVQWHNLVVWGKQAENVAKYVNKGDQLYVEGQLKTDEYEKDGIKRWATKIIAREVKFLTPKETGHSQLQAPQQAQRTPPQRSAQQPQLPQASPTYQPHTVTQEYLDAMSDIPF